MRTRTAFAAVFCLLASFPASAHAQEALGVEDVRVALENTFFQKALGGCFEKENRPDEITLVLIVQAQGGTQLSRIEDEQYSNILDCISKAVTHLKMPATGSHFQITVSVPVPAPAPSSALEIKQLDEPPPAPPPSVPPVSAPPAAIPLVAAPAVPLVAHPVSSKPPPPEPTPEWKIRYSKGKKRLIGGIVALGAGLQFAVVGGLGFLGTMPYLCDSSKNYTDEYTCHLWIGLGVSLLTIGVVGTIIGAVLVVQGKRIKAEALESKPRLSIGPLPGGDGAMASLGWRF